MTRYHILIEANQTIDESSKFWKVAVGTSQQANRDYLYLLAFCVDHNFYFQLWSNEVDTFLHNIAKSLNQISTETGVMTLPIQTISARDLVKSIKTATAVKPNLMAEQNRNRLLSLLDSNYFFFEQNRQTKQNFINGK